MINMNRVCDMTCIDEADNIIIENYKSGAIYRKMIPYKIINGNQKYKGREYYENGNIRYEGILQRGGLFMGKYFYPDGALKFIGNYCERKTGVYYGPPYPVYGEYYSEEGALLYSGKFEINRMNGVGYPIIVNPKGFNR